MTASRQRRVGEPGGPRRVVLYGVTGSGKTTAARRLAAATGLPFAEADQLTWEPGWVQVSEAEQRRRIGAVCAGDSWVLDTAYGQWSDVPLARAELLVALDYPRWVSLGRLLRRTAVRIVTRRRACNDNVESLRQALSGESIIAWHFRSFARKRERIDAWQSGYAAGEPGPAVLRFTRPRDLEAWLRAHESSAHLLHVTPTASETKDRT